MLDTRPEAETTTSAPPRTRVLREVAAVAVLSIVLTTAMAWPQVQGLTTKVPLTLNDPLDFAFQLAWIGHALPLHPLHLWTTNAFLGAHDNLAFTDVMVGYAPFAWLGRLFGSGQPGALAALNLVLLFSTAVAFAGAYALARALGARWPGALVAGAGFGFALWRLEQVIHPNVMSTGGMPLTLALLAWGHGWTLRHGWRPETVRPGLAALGWAVACWQLSLGFAIGLPFAYVVAGVTALWVLGWLLTGARRLPRGLVVADTVGPLAFALTGAVLTRPLFWVSDHYPQSRRDLSAVSQFSPPWHGLITAPETNVWWSARTARLRAGISWPPEEVLLPGFLLIGLALLGLVVSAWPWRRRVGLLLATAVAVVLTLGHTFPDQGRRSYDLLYWHLPGWNALRTPGRLIIWVTLGLCLLAAGAVSVLSDRLSIAMGLTDELGRPAPGQRLATRSRLSVGSVATIVVLLVPSTLIVLEGRGVLPMQQVMPPPVALKTLPAPVFVLPSGPGGQIPWGGDYHVMLWTTDGFPKVANGDSGFYPDSQEWLVRQTNGFPSAASVAVLRRHRVATVVIVRSLAQGTPFAAAAERPVTGLGITREDRGSVVVYHLG